MWCLDDPWEIKPIGYRGWTFYQGISDFSIVQSYTDYQGIQGISGPVPGYTGICGNNTIQR